MPVPFGFGVGDFVAVGTLAWNVYKSCKDAPQSFGKISIEVLSLHAVLKEAEETVLQSPQAPGSQHRLKIVYDGCQNILEDLNELLKKYASLGTQSKRSWDRMKYGSENVAELRARLTSSTTMLGVFISTSQIRVEQKLNVLAEEHRRGYHEASVLSVQTTDSLSADDKLTWREIRKKLEDIGISVAAFDANQDFILKWLSDAVESGAFDEKITLKVGEVRSMSRAFPSPAEFSIEATEPPTAESGLHIDPATDVSRRTDTASYTIPEDGRAISIPVRKLGRERRKRRYSYIEGGSGGVREVHHEEGWYAITRIGSKDLYQAVGDDGSARMGSKDGTGNGSCPSDYAMTSLLIEYFEGVKDHDGPRPSIRVKVHPSAAGMIKNTNDRSTVPEAKDGRKPSYTRRISLR